MYLQKVHIENIRSIAELDWEIGKGKEAGWHVIIGDNGSGKSTLLRAISLALVGTAEAGAPWIFGALGQDWLRKPDQEAKIDLQLVSPLKFVEGADRIIEGTQPTLAKNEGTGSLQILAYTDPHVSNGPMPGQGINTRNFTHPKKDSHVANMQELIGFSAAYGPFRRFTGAVSEAEKSLSIPPRLDAHLSIFREDAALTKGLAWLMDLDYRKAKKMPVGKLMEQVKEFINQKDFLPHRMQLTDISPDGVMFEGDDWRKISIIELSDGYRSLLSMTLEIIRRMSETFEIDQIFSQDDPTKVVASGIVLIDEVDAHLHPTWQGKIGLKLCEVFTNIQFIVTTHSRLVCQAAEHGTVFRLPAPGSGEKAKMVKGVELNRLLYGNVLDAYGTELFGEDVGRSDRRGVPLLTGCPASSWSVVGGAAG